MKEIRRIFRTWKLFLKELCWKIHRSLFFYYVHYD